MQEPSPPRAHPPRRSRRRLPARALATQFTHAAAAIREHRRRRADHLVPARLARARRRDREPADRRCAVGQGIRVAGGCAVDRAPVRDRPRRVPWLLHTEQDPEQVDRPHRIPAFTDALQPVGDRPQSRAPRVHQLEGQGLRLDPLLAGRFARLPWVRRKLEHVYRSGVGQGVYYMVEMWWKKLFFPDRKHVATRRTSYTWDSLLVAAFAALGSAA